MCESLINASEHINYVVLFLRLHHKKNLQKSLQESLRSGVSRHPYRLLGPGSVWFWCWEGFVGPQVWIRIANTAANTAHACMLGNRICLCFGPPCFQKKRGFYQSAFCIMSVTSAKVPTTKVPKTFTQTLMDPAK